LKVFRRGRLVAETPAATSALQLPGRPASTSMMTRTEQTWGIGE
ncbi:MAG: hypothetical protein H6R17_3582, partial [Proteobacteria bacterium]|nr:hypothetical protein [Pseudomonadota bacterium]